MHAAVLFASFIMLAIIMAVAMYMVFPILKCTVTSSYIVIYTL